MDDPEAHAAATILAEHTVLIPLVSSHVFMDGIEPRANGTYFNKFFAIGHSKPKCYVPVLIHRMAKTPYLRLPPKMLVALYADCLHVPRRVRRLRTNSEISKQHMILPPRLFEHFVQLRVGCSQNPVCAYWPNTVSVRIFPVPSMQRVTLPKCRLIATLEVAFPIGRRTNNIAIQVGFMNGAAILFRVRLILIQPSNTANLSNRLCGSYSLARGRRGGPAADLCKTLECGRMRDQTASTTPKPGANSVGLWC